MSVKYFKTEVVLIITHRKLLCAIDQVYRICNFLTGDTLYTHQLPRAIPILKPWVLQQHPALSHWDESEINQWNVPQYVGRAKALFGDWLPLAPLPPGQWTHIDPVEEARAMFGDDNVIAVKPSSAK